MFMTSVILWCFSCFSRRFIKITKFGSLIGILITFFMIPLPIILIYGPLNWGITAEYTKSIYILVMIIAILIMGKIAWLESS